MTKREKVLKGLECHGNGRINCQGNCPYYNDERCQRSLCNNALELIKEQRGWISVEDRMPPELHSMLYPLYGTQKWREAMWREESDKVIVSVMFSDGTKYVTTGETHDGKWYTTISRTIPHTVTHWMPLPEPPEEVKPE